ncbi:hypothetical protein Tco_0842275 [Tanacetum coccineum]|uniref:Uncharacterized protein n=1 Tax=Tanacetum coccineum TaxID=301880 RepID=A0ABQ5B234_9ASTR
MRVCSHVCRTFIILINVVPGNVKNVQDYLKSKHLKVECLFLGKNAGYPKYNLDVAVLGKRGTEAAPWSYQGASSSQTAIPQVGSYGSSSSSSGSGISLVRHGKGSNRSRVEPEPLCESNFESVPFEDGSKKYHPEMPPFEKLIKNLNTISQNDEDICPICLEGGHLSTKPSPGGHEQNILLKILELLQNVRIIITWVVSMNGMREAKLVQFVRRSVVKINDPQCELLLIRACAGVSKLYFAMRTCPPRVFQSAQHAFDTALRSALERIVTASGPGFGDWQWRLATLPFAFGGLGIYSAGDVLNYAFIASRLQSDTLQTKLLRHVGIVASGSTFDEALCVFNNAFGKN